MTQYMYRYQSGFVFICVIFVKTLLPIFLYVKREYHIWLIVFRFIFSLHIYLHADKLELKIDYGWFYNGVFVSVICF